MDGLHKPLKRYITLTDNGGIVIRNGDGSESVISEENMDSIERSLSAIATNLAALVQLMSGNVAVSADDVAAMGKGAMPGFTGNEGPRLTMVHDGAQYVREDIGGGRWLKYHVDEHGRPQNAQVELANGERIDIELDR